MYRLPRYCVVQYLVGLCGGVYCVSWDARECVVGCMLGRECVVGCMLGGECVVDFKKHK